MTKHRSLAAQLAQSSLLDILTTQAEEAARVPCAIPARLLIVQCGKSKDQRAELMPARDRYTGPVWQSVRKADPTSSRCFLAALSAKLGLVDARTPIENYDAELNDHSADAMVQAGANACYPLVASEAKTQAGRSRHLSRMAEMRRTSAMETIILVERELGRPLREICIVGGHRYVRVATAWMEELKRVGILSRGCAITVINDEIGRMRSRAAAWIAEG